MTTLRTAVSEDAGRTSFAHIRIRGANETEALEQYIKDRIDKQSRIAPEVLWYEVVIRGRIHHRCSRQYAAIVTAHLRHKDVTAAQSNSDSFLAARDVFDLLAQRLHRVRDVAELRAQGASGPKHDRDRS